jgi:hypothetical protein
MPWIGYINIAQGLLNTMPPRDRHATPMSEVHPGEQAQMNDFEREQGRRILNGLMDQPCYTAADYGQEAGDHTAFVKYWVDKDGNMHIEDIHTEEVFKHRDGFPRTQGRTVFEDGQIQIASRPHGCPVRETRWFTECHDGMRRDKRTKRWQTCEICQGFGSIE